MSPDELPPFSHPLAVDKIPARGLKLRIEAGPKDLEAVARWLDLRDVAQLVADLEISPIGRTGLVSVNGRLTARVTQSCGVTLAPVAAEVAEDIAMTFGPPEEETEEGDGAELDIGFDESDPPDPIIDGAIDLGAVMVEHLALGLDPFPRAEGAEFSPIEDKADEPEAKANPFAVLASLKQNK